MFVAVAIPIDNLLAEKNPEMSSDEVARRRTGNRRVLAVAVGVFYVSCLFVSLSWIWVRVSSEV